MFLISRVENFNTSVRVETLIFKFVVLGMWLRTFKQL